MVLPKMSGSNKNTYRKNNHRGKKKPSGQNWERFNKGQRQKQSNAGGQNADNKVPKMRKWQKHNYQPEYRKIALPKRPDNLRCAICHKAISGKIDLIESLEICLGEFSTENQDSNIILPAHFRCVLCVLTESVSLGDKESIAYLGSGKFAIVQGTQRIVLRMIDRIGGIRNLGLAPTDWETWRQNMISHRLIEALSLETDI